MKKVLSSVVCVLMLLGMMAVSATAAEYSIKLEYTVDENDAIVVKTKINNGSAAPYTQVQLCVNGDTVETKDSGGSYTCTFDYDMPESVQEVLLVTNTYSSGGDTFNGCTVDITHEFVTESSDNGDTQEEPLTEGSGEYVVSPSGAVFSETDAKLSADIEKAVATVSGNDVKEWGAQSSLSMEREMYDTLFADVRGQVHVEVSYAAALDRTKWYLTAKNNHADFTQYDDSEIRGITLDLHLVTVTGDDRERIVLSDDNDVKFVISVPVPRIITECERYAIVGYDQNGISELQTVTPAVGVLTWETDKLQPVAIIGAGSLADIVVSEGSATVNGNRVQLPIDVDRALETDFGIATQVLMGKTVFWMNKSDYDQLVDPAVAALHLEIRSANQHLTNDMVIAAKNNHIHYRDYANNQVKSVALELRLMYSSERMHAAIDSSNKILSDWTFDKQIAMQIPVPASLKSSAVIAVASITENGVSMLTPVAQDGGMITLPSSVSLGKIVLVGLGDAKKDGPKKASFLGMFRSWKEIPVEIWAMVIGGVLLVVVGIVLLIRITFRNKKEAEQMAKGELEDQSDSIMLCPTEDEEIEQVDDIPELKEEVPTILAEIDEHLELTGEEREAYRAKSQIDQEVFAQISREAVSPAKQISKQQWEIIREDAENDNHDVNSHVSVDDLLDEVNDDLNRLDKRK